MKPATLIGLALGLILTVTAWAPPTEAALTDATVAAGLKEALQIGTTNAVVKTGKTDGYYKNPAIKILMPEKLRNVERILRSMGLGKQVDEFVLSMNRAAEQAAPAAKAIFWDAIKQLTFSDVKKILKGGDTAATEYFKAKTSDQLTAAFTPIVAKATDQYGVTRQYKKLSGYARRIPFVRPDALDMDSYVVREALNGLFYMLGEEEKKIRRDPLARITKLLQQVFGGS